MADTAPDTCQVCGTNLSNPSEETLLKKAEKECSYSPASKKVAMNEGDLYLTNLRLICLDATGGHGTGTLIWAASQTLAKAVLGGKGFSVPLDDVTSIEPAKFGLITKAFAVMLKDGTGVKVNPKPLDEWIEAIEKAKNTLPHR